MSRKLKRNRSHNWDEEEKRLLRLVLKKYVDVIENKSLDNNTNKMKVQAWEDIHKRFNELNRQQRDLNQLKIQWKTMKVNARKKNRGLKSEISKKPDVTRTSSDDDTVKDLLNVEEANHNSCNTDSVYSKPMAHVVNALHCINDDQDSDEVSNLCIDMEPQEPEETPIVNPQDGPSSNNHTKKNINTNETKKYHDEYVNNMANHTKTLKEKELSRRIQMAEEEHSIKIAIEKERLKCMVLEREILELKKLEMFKRNSD